MTAVTENLPLGTVVKWMVQRGSRKRELRGFILGYTVGYYVMHVFPHGSRNRVLKGKVQIDERNGLVMGTDHLRTSAVPEPTGLDADIKALYLQGVSYDAIVRAVGKRKSLVSTRIRAMGLSRPKRLSDKNRARGARSDMMKVPEKHRWMVNYGTK
jgi:hypothetical protein